tara:strand:- start:7910 stop:8080 length:171 start_codon:yes stop_codon:yes gene_type:complete
MNRTTVRADIIVRAKLDLDEFNADTDELGEIVSDYVSDLLYDVEGIEPVSITVRTK